MKEDAGSAVATGDGWMYETVQLSAGHFLAVSKKENRSRTIWWSFGGVYYSCSCGLRDSQSWKKQKKRGARRCKFEPRVLFVWCKQCEQKLATDKNEQAPWAVRLD